jgi:hypothetical protein
LAAEWQIKSANIFQANTETLAYQRSTVSLRVKAMSHELPFIAVFVTVVAIDLQEDFGFTDGPFVG